MRRRRLRPVGQGPEVCVSSFLNEAARERLARLELRGLLDELDVKHDAAPAAVRAEIARAARRIFRTR